MASIYDSVDLDFSWDGDFIVDDRGDLKDSSDDLLRSIKTEILTVVKSALGDWREDTSVGAGLDDFVGEQNSRETAEGIKLRLTSSLSSIVNTSDLTLRMVPVNVYKILILMTLEVLPTVENRLQAGATISATFLYDYVENGIYVDFNQQSQFTGR